MTRWCTRLAALVAGLPALCAAQAPLLHGLPDVRVGGPFLAKLPAGTLLQASGRRGEHLRVQLAPTPRPGSARPQ
jgi:hypothetical protein